MRKIEALIVEDSDITRKMIMKHLASTGLADFTFIEAVDGLDALEKYHPARLDLLFVDMQMPRMDGITFLKKIRAEHPDGPPAVMITSESAEALVNQAIREAKVDGFMLKPVDVDRLRKGLKKLIDSLPDRLGPSAVPHGEVVPDALARILKQMCNLDLEAEPVEESVRRTNIIFGQIYILGGVEWSIVVGFQEETAEAVASRFAGFDIPLDSPDMGDAISELTNIVAGQIQRLLGERSIVVDISLPIVNAAASLRTLAQRSSTIEHWHFRSEVGRLWASATVGLNPGLVL